MKVSPNATPNASATGGDAHEPVHTNGLAAKSTHNKNIIFAGMCSHYKGMSTRRRMASLPPFASLRVGHLGQREFPEVEQLPISPNILHNIGLHLSACLKCMGVYLRAAE